MNNKCVFSEDRKYRYTLKHTFDLALAGACINFIMLNPSTADETQLDPTLRRCKGFAQREGFGSFVVTNLFAYRATDPQDMRRVLDPIGPANDDWISRVASECKVVVCGWGNHGSYIKRDEHVKRKLRLLRESWGLVVMHLGDLTQGGHPRHPLYLSIGAPLVPFA